MRMNEVLLRALNGELTWVQAAEIMGLSPRSMRRWRWRLENIGTSGLIDRRRQTSKRKVPGKVIAFLLRLYRTRYRGFNVRHFHAVLKREHKFSYSYTFVRQILLGAGLVKKKRPRGRHRLRRQPRAMFGEMLHIDGSPHRWLALCPEERFTLIAMVDDASKQLLYGRLVDGESTEAILTALRTVFLRHGLPQAIYSDRASWAAYTPVKHEAVDKSRLTQVGRALKRLGIEHILAYSPQARGRSERVNRTLQDRLVNELRIQGIRSIERANRYLEESFRPHYNLEFGRAPLDPASAFVSVGPLDLDQVLCFEDERTVLKDNTVGCDGIRLQIPKQRGRLTCAGLLVTVRRHLNQHYSIWRGPRCFAQFDSRGRLKGPETAAPAEVEEISQGVA